MSNTKSPTLSAIIEALSEDMRDIGASTSELSFDNYKHMVRVTIKVKELYNY